MYSRNSHTLLNINNNETLHSNVKLSASQRKLLDNVTRNFSIDHDICKLSTEQIIGLQTFFHHWRYLKEQGSCREMLPNCDMKTITINDINHVLIFLEQNKEKKIYLESMPDNKKYCLNKFDQPILINPNNDVQNALPNFSQNIPNLVPQNRMTDLYNPDNNDLTTCNYLLNRPQTMTRGGRKTTNDGVQWKSINATPNNTYHNPYEYGARQNEFGALHKPYYTGPYQINEQMSTQMGLPDPLYLEQFPGAIRNVNVESFLYQSENTHLPGQRNLTQKEINRFELLPFDPQDVRHIVFEDNMPRGGYATRVDRLERI